jgi:hypothetical protein
MLQLFCKILTKIRHVFISIFVYSVNALLQVEFLIGYCSTLQQEQKTSSTINNISSLASNISLNVKQDHIKVAIKQIYKQSIKSQKFKHP